MKRVLIAEDEYVTAELFKHVVENRLKPEVVAVVHSGVEAIEQVRTLKPDVALLDIKMEEDCAGIEACKKIKEEFPHIKVFLLTAYSKETLKSLLDDVCYDGYIDKLRFSEVVKEILENC